ncbi:MAG: PQQ-dependent sugar dehydrogenase [Myxococcales bacterium]|nr:MAG: PQQ-dependent sugar dehydrogenase [Myxococcales bacterium]
MRERHLLSAAVVSLVFGCSKQPAPQATQPEQVAKVVPAAGKGESTEPRVGPNPDDQPVETAPPNVPDFKPAFPEQTRAKAVHTQSKFHVAEVGGPFAQPWALAFLPDGRLLVTEKHSGKLLAVGPDGKKTTAVAGVPRVDGRDQGGLLDVELSPTFGNDKLVYLSYYEPREGGNGLAVARARLMDGAQPKLNELQVVFRMLPTLDSTKHAGGRLVFAPDGTLFVTLGERSIKEGRVQARDLGSHFGKIVRIFPDGKVPKDNPYVGKAGARPEIWTSGHRNVLAADLDAKNRLWVVEMGPRGGDELNLVERGKDYGWPTIGYGEEYSGEPIHEVTQAAGLQQPVYYWDPVISPGALTIYDGAMFPEWKGNFFVAGLSSKALIRLVVEGEKVVGEERLITDRAARIREVVQGPEGALYLLTDGDDGKLLKLTPGP